MTPSLIKEDEPGSTRQIEGNVLAFQVGERTFGLPIGHVLGFAELGIVTPIPLAPPYVIGVFDVSGRAVTLVDLQKRLGQPSCDPYIQQHCLLLNTTGGGSAFLVDAVLGIIEVSERTDSKPASEPNRDLYHLCTGAVRNEDETILMLDAEKVLNSDDYDDSNGTMKSAQPVLRLVASDNPAERTSRDDKPDPEQVSLFSDLGGHKGIAQIADDIAFKILDDDALNPFLGSLNAVQFPDIVAHQLIDFVTDQTTQGTKELETVLARLIFQQGFDQTHFQRMLIHVENALLASPCSAESCKTMRQWLIGFWEKLAA